MKPDLNKISIREYRELFDSTKPDEEGDKILAKACGVSPEEIGSMPYNEYRRLIRDLIAAAREPLTDPN